MPDTTTQPASPPVRPSAAAPSRSVPARRRALPAGAASQRELVALSLLLCGNGKS